MTAAHLEAMDCRDVEDLVSVAVSLFNSIKQSVARWHTRGEALSTEQEIAEGRRYYHLYETAASLFQVVTGLVERITACGFVVEGATELTAADRELRGILSVPFDRMVKSVAQLRAGQSRPLGEVMGELRDRHHA